MKQDITRKQFLHLGLGATAAALGCGSDSNDTGAGTADTTGTTDPSATDPSATDPSATDPSATDPSATDPSATDPSATDPTSATDPSTSSADSTDTGTSSGTDPTGDSSSSGGGESSSSSGGESSSSGEPFMGCVDDPGVAISANHGHAVVVTLEEVEAGAMVVYDIQGDNNFHTHSLTVTPEDFATLQETGTVDVLSGLGGGHMHTVTLTCA